MSVTPKKLRIIADTAREIELLKIIQIQEEEQRLRRIQERMLQEQTEISRATEKKKIAIANRLRSAERKIVVGSFNGELTCDIEVEEECCLAVVAELESIGFSVRIPTSPNEDEVFIELWDVGTQLSKAIDDVEEFQLKDYYKPVSKERILSEALRRGDPNSILIDIPNIRKYLIDIKLEQNKIEKSLEKICDSCPSEDLQKNFLCAFNKPNTFDYLYECNMSEAFVDYEDWRLEFNSLHRLGYILTLANSVVLQALDALKTVPSNEEDGVVYCAIEDAELRGKKIIEISWGSSDWESIGFSNKFDGALATWMTSVSGQGMRSNIEASMQECAHRGLNELNITLELLPENSKRWGPTRVWKLSAENMPMGIFPSTPKRFAKILRNIGFSVRLNNNAIDVCAVSINW